MQRNLTCQTPILLTSSTTKCREVFEKPLKTSPPAGLTVTDALSRIREELDDTPEVRAVAQFVENSSRGIVK